MVFTRRLGRFFLFFGTVVLAVFVISDLVDAPSFNMFFLGFLSLITGIFMLRRSRTAPGPSSRFRWLRSLRQRGAGSRGGRGDDASDNE